MVQIMIKEVYGRVLKYPANKNAMLLVKLTGRKTFQKEDIDVLKELGFQVEYVNKISEE